MLQPQQRQPIHELQRLTILLEEQEEIASSAVNQILSYQPVADCVRDLAHLYLEARTKRSEREEKMKSKGQREARMNQVQAQIEQQKSKIKKFRQKMQTHIMSTSTSIKRLLAYSTTHNILTLTQKSIHGSLLSLIHSPHPCTHGHPASNKQNGRAKCDQDCQYGQFMDFLRSYKNSNLCHRFAELWVNMEREVFREISHFVRLYGQDIEQGQPGLEDTLKVLENEIMDLRVDMEILDNQLASLCSSLGIQDDSTFPSAAQFVNQIVFVLEKGLDHQMGSRNVLGSKIDGLSCALADYIEKIFQEYSQENKGQSNLVLKEEIDRLAISQVARSLQKCINHIQSSHRIEEQIKKVQALIQSLQREKQQSESEQKSKQTMQSAQGSKLTISSRYNIECMSFKVKKIMHISTINLAGPITVNEGCRSSRTSKSMSSTRRTNRSSIGTIRIGHEDQSSRECFERILQFGRNKLILRKENPHFHEEIEIKRITLVKVLSDNLVFLYFKKGYLSLEFIAHQGRKHCESMAREWTKIFQVIYLDYTGRIECMANQRKREPQAEEKENSLANSNFIVEEEEYKVLEEHREQDLFVQIRSFRKK